MNSRMNLIQIGGSVNISILECADMKFEFERKSLTSEFLLY